MYSNVHFDDLFKSTKSNNFYTEEINRKLNNYMTERQKISLDVTSPGVLALEIISLQQSEVEYTGAGIIMLVICKSCLHFSLTILHTKHFLVRSKK